MRNYKSQTQFKGDEPWTYPKTTDWKAESKQFNKKSFQQLPSLIKQRNAVVDIPDQGQKNEVLQKIMKVQPQTCKYMDKFRGGNVNVIRQAFKKGVNLQNAQFEADLRHYHPDKMPPIANKEGVVIVIKK